MFAAKPQQLLTHHHYTLLFLHHDTLQCSMINVYWTWVLWWQITNKLVDMPSPAIHNLHWQWDASLPQQSVDTHVYLVLGAGFVRTYQHCFMGISTTQTSKIPEFFDDQNTMPSDKSCQFLWEWFRWLIKSTDKTIGNGWFSQSYDIDCKLFETHKWT